VALQDLLNLIGGIGLTALGWFARELWSAVKELKTDLAKLREELPKTYAPKDDVKDGFREVKEMLTDIYQELRKKADK
jgi:sugar-specific transcriptional regulator TrmB